MSTKWVEMFRHWVAPRATLKGVWRRRDGGWLVRGRARDPTTGKQRALVRVVLTESATEARVELDRLLKLVRDGRPEAVIAAPGQVCLSLSDPSRKLFCEYAASLFERKVRERKIKSEAGVEKWKGYLERVLIPAFGAFQCAEVRRAHVMAWRDKVAERVAAGSLSPNTANSWLSVLRVIINAYVSEYELERNPATKIPPFDTTTHHTYTDEEPNSLTPEEVPAFLAAMRKLYPQHHAFTVLLFATGLRPSSLRPLRRRGPTSDVDWSKGELKVRRSHTRKQTVMEATKTGKRQTIPLPPQLLEVLRWHVDLLDGERAESDLLFPSETGGLRSTSTLDKVFRKVAKAAGIRKRLTPRSGRRTFQDLTRAAGVHAFVTRAVSGHQTEDMHELYSTASRSEITDGLAKVIELARVRESLAAPGPGPVKATRPGGPKVVRKAASK